MEVSTWVKLVLCMPEHAQAFLDNDVNGELAAMLGAEELQEVRKRLFLRHLYMKCIILPRQARDKHRENSKKGRFLAGSGGCVRCGSSEDSDADRQGSVATRRQPDAARAALDAGARAE
jgi:hypothetical protein